MINFDLLLRKKVIAEGYDYGIYSNLEYYQSKNDAIIQSQAKSLKNTKVLIQSLASLRNLRYKFDRLLMP